MCPVRGAMILPDAVVSNEIAQLPIDGPRLHGVFLKAHRESARYRLISAAVAVLADAPDASEVRSFVRVATIHPELPVTLPVF